MRKNINNKKTLNIIFLFCTIFLLSFTTVNLFNPIIKSSATSLDSSLEISIDTVLSMSQSSDTISIDVTPTSDGAFGIGSNTYTVSTNNITGYTLSLSDSDTNTSLTHVADNTINIPTLEETLSNVDKTTFTKDKWGISIDYTVPDNPSNPSNPDPSNQGSSSSSSLNNGTGTFNPIPASNGTSFTLSSTSSPSTSTTNLTIGSKISTDKTSGLYADTLIVSAIANDAPVYHKVFGGITTMQEMTPEICAAEPTPAADAETPSVTTYTNGYTSASVDAVPQAILTDTRDGKTYVVRKLANGTCWMSQNLDLDLVANEPIEAYDFSTNTTFNFTPQNTTQTTTGTTWTQTGTEGARSFDNGNKYCTGDTGNQDCTATSSTDPTDHIGNYYNWYAATAGTGTSNIANYTEVSSSICPKGWRLPAAYDPSDTKSFANLFSSYDLPITTSSSSGSDSNSPSIIIEKTPLSFLRSGKYSYSDGQLSEQSSMGFYWSSMSFGSAMDAYGFYFSATNFSPKTVNSKATGISVRCVAR